MKILNIAAVLSLLLFVGCGGSGEQQQTQQSTDMETEQTQTTSDDVRTIDIIGVDQMKFVVEESTEGITVGDPVGSTDMLLLENISAEPGEEIRIRLTTQSDLPATAMAHNWVLLALNADVEAFVNAAIKAKDNGYIPSGMTDQIITHTELAAGGETVEVTFTAPEKPGDYQFVCTFPGHYAAGMKGILKVEGSGS